MTNSIWVALYILGLLGLGVFGLHALILTLLFLIRPQPAGPAPPSPDPWPAVTVQLPIYNEQHVVKRLIEAVCALDYPAKALSIQVLDDSTDETTALARQEVTRQRQRGLTIELLHRRERTGFKGGALAAGLCSAPGELIAVFDADFVPQPDFLKRMVPYLAHDPALGMVQARWGHLNAEYSPLTRAQALSLDGQFVVVQAARCRWGLLVKFNGSAGIWRRQCIEEAGGWQGDTLTEDLDLSFRAQIKGWRLAYVPEVVVPAELTPEIAALKRQQYRWAHGSVRVLLKLGGQLWRAPLPLLTRLEGFIHLTAYLANLIVLFLVVVCTPILLLADIKLPALPWLFLFGIGAPALFFVSQWAIYPDWPRRILYVPLLALLGVGLGLNNTLAVLAALRGRPIAFARTPKFHLESRGDTWLQKIYSLPAQWTVIGELALTLYAAIVMVAALTTTFRLASVLGLALLGYGLVGSIGLYQASLNSRLRNK